MVLDHDTQENLLPLTMVSPTVNLTYAVWEPADDSVRDFYRRYPSQEMTGWLTRLYYSTVHLLAVTLFAWWMLYLSIHQIEFGMRIGRTSRRRGGSWADKNRPERLPLAVGK